MEKTGKHRVKKKYTSPNPLFVEWLTEWKQEAAEKGLKTQYTYSKALFSLKKYPLPLSSGKEAGMLKNFGDKICSMLDAKLLEWRKGNSSLSSSQSSVETDQSGSSQSSLSSKLLATKIKASSPRAPTHSTVQIKTVKVGRVLNVAPQSKAPVESEQDMEVEADAFSLYPGHFSLILCVDNAESVSGHGKSKKQFVSELQKSKVDHEVRKLHVGDFVWIARDNSNPDRELVLDYIIERKRLDDLAHSIKDGRFREQKFRMKNCALRNPIYLVENCSGAKYLGIPESTLEQAVTNTQVCDGFVIKKTQNIRESVSYLTTMTNMIRSRYQYQTLTSGSREAVQRKKATTNIFICFKDFNCSSIKNKSLTIKEMFAKHLMQFSGLSVDRATAIVEQFKTPSDFLEAYSNCNSENERIQMVSNIKFGLSKKNIGIALSKSLLQHYAPS